MGRKEVKNFWNNHLLFLSSSLPHHSLHSQALPSLICLVFTQLNPMFPIQNLFFPHSKAFGSKKKSKWRVLASFGLAPLEVSDLNLIFSLNSCWRSMIECKITKKFNKYHVYAHPIFLGALVGVRFWWFSWS